MNPRKERKHGLSVCCKLAKCCMNNYTVDVHADRIAFSSIQLLSHYHLFCRVDDGIGHFRFTEELDGQIIAGTTKFDNMIALIDYYKNNPVRLQTKLTHAVNEKILLERVS